MLDRSASPRTPWIALAVTVLATVAAAKPRPAPKPAPAVVPASLGWGAVYTVDDAHSFVEFSARLVGFNRVRGAFPDYEAHIYYDPDSIGRASVNVRIAVAGVSTHEAERDHHLESPDFFDAARFPYMRFDSREVVAAPDGFVVRGDLTIRDVTRPVAIPFAITAPLGQDPFGNTRFSAAGRLTLSSRDLGVIGPKFWNGAIGDSIEIEVGARRWNYDTLGWGSARRPSIGERIFRTTDSLGVDRALEDSRALWMRAHADTTWNFGVFEYVKCAGRLGQHERPRDGAQVLAQAIELQGDSLAAPDLAAVRCQRAELLLRAGDPGTARNELQLALAADSASTYARALRRAF
jgi:polyisoprenoid-binding protein YceI